MPSQPASLRSPLQQQHASRPSVAARAGGNDSEPAVVYNKEFGYSRKDILIIGAGLIAFGYAAYYGLQAAGVEAGFAGNVVQLVIFMGICVFWVSTYVYRVATKVRLAHACMRVRRATGKAHRGKEAC